jgi:hypothetical protein
MTISKGFARRLLVAGGLAMAIAAAPATAMLAAPIAGADVDEACPAGESNDVYTGMCIPDMAPLISSPCTGRMSVGTCQALQQQVAGNQAMIPNPVPQSTLSAD